METLPPLNITFVDAYGNTAANNFSAPIAESAQLEFPFMKVQFPAITGYTFPAITELGSNTFVSISK